jgi:tetratricopeptide (TPR) repeat protein
MNAAAAAATGPPRWLVPGLCLLLAAATLWVYWPVRGHEFVNYDDTVMILDNPNLRAPVTLANLAAHLWTPFEGNWLPVTWLSLHLGFALHGANAGAFLLTNVAIHVSAALLLFLALLRMTGAPGASAFVAGVFALHPLHVESVAWITERKDVLAGFFWMLGLWVYGGWVESPSRPRYAALCGCLALGLMSKASVVTFPFALLLLDVWPLRRASFGGASAGRATAGWRELLDEKVPLFAMVIPLLVLTYKIQAVDGMTSAGDRLSPGARLLNAVESYALYVRDAFWPEGLAALYPHPYMEGPPLAGDVGLGIALAGLLIGATAFAIAQLRVRPYLAVGWLWFVGTLVPMIGLVQVGLQARADRYTYIPLVGLSLVVAFAARELAGRAPVLQRAIPVAGVAALAACALVARAQVGYWHDSLSLFERAAAVTENNGFAHEVIAREYANQGRNEEAVAHFAEAVRVNPGRVRSHFGRAVVLMRLGRDEEAIESWRAGLRYQSNKIRAHEALGLLLVDAGRFDEALPHLERALSALPEDPALLAALARAREALAVEAAGDTGVRD